MTDQLDVLRTSVARLARIAEPLGPDQLRLSAYPSEWTIADVLSHVGSGATLMRARIDSTVAGEELPDDYAEPVWAAWNARAPEAQAADALVADRELVARVELVTDEERARCVFAMGPLQLDLGGLVGLRVNEHTLHTWDIEVALDPAATLPQEAVDVVIDSLSMIAQFTGKPSGTEHDIHVHTTSPTRDFTLALGAGSVTLTPSDPVGTPDLELPSEALIRLVYGRLDAEHTPPVRGTADLDELRSVFPGI